jgi:hypothetical protein
VWRIKRELKDRGELSDEVKNIKLTAKEANRGRKRRSINQKKTKGI